MKYSRERWTETQEDCLWKAEEDDPYWRKCRWM